MPIKRTGVRKRRKPLRRSSRAQRAAILAEARANRLTGKQVVEKYDISLATYYLWRRQVGAKWFAVGDRTAWKTRRGMSALERLVNRVIEEEIESVLK